MWFLILVVFPSFMLSFGEQTFGIDGNLLQEARLGSGSTLRASATTQSSVCHAVFLLFPSTLKYRRLQAEVILLSFAWWHIVSSQMSVEWVRDWENEWICWIGRTKDYRGSFHVGPESVTLNYGQVWVYLQTLSSSLSFSVVPMIVIGKLCH